MNPMHAAFWPILLGTFLWWGSAASQQKSICSFDRKPSKDPSKVLGDIIPQVPFVRISSNAHAGVINFTSAATAAPLVATASGDKSIRLWDAARALDPVKTLYPPLGFAGKGVATYVSLSPDGKLLAATGAFGFDIPALYIFDTASGEIVFCMSPNQLATVVHFRPSGELLFSLDKDLYSIDLSTLLKIEPSDGRSTITRPKPPVKVASLDAEIVEIAESARGQVAVLDKASQVRLFSPDLKLTASAAGGQGAIVKDQPEINAWHGKLVLKKIAGNGRPFSMSFSPSGHVLAIGFEGAARVELVSSRNLATVLQVDLPKDKYAETKLVKVLDHGIAISFARSKTSGAAPLKNFGVVIVSDSGLGPLDEVFDTADTVTALAVVGGGDLVVSSGDGRLALLRQGKLVKDVPATKLDFRYLAEGKSFGVSGDGRVLFRPEPKAPMMMADFVSAKFTNPVNESTEKPRYSLDGATVADIAEWRVTKQPKVFGKPLPMDEGERSLSAAMAPNKMVALGTDYRIRVIAPSGKELRGIRSEQAVWAVGFSPDGSRLVAAIGDGTFRYYDVDDSGIRSEVAAAYMEAGGETWVVWTPDGFFDHSQGRAKELVGFLLNGSDRDIVPSYLSFAQLYGLLYASDHVRQLVKGNNDAAFADAAKRKKEELGVVRERVEKAIPPQVAATQYCYDISEIRCVLIGQRANVASSKGVTRGMSLQAVEATETTKAPEEECDASSATAPCIEIPASVKTVKVTFSAKVKDGGVGLSRLYIDGKKQEEQRLDNQTTGAIVSIEKDVDVTSGDVEVQLRMYDKTNTAFHATQKVRFYNSTAFQAMDKQKGRLFTIVVGIDDYSKARPYENLGNAVSDAKQFAELVDKTSKGAFTSVTPVTLYNEKATTARILEEIAKVAKEAKPEDTVLVYLAGHGKDFELPKKPETRDYFFLTATSVLTNDQKTEVEKTRGVDKKRAYAAVFSESSLTGRTLFGEVSKIRTSKLMVFLDTCHGGSTQFAEALGKRSDDSGLFILAAAGGSEEGLDATARGDSGPFARAVKNALEGGVPKPNKYLSQLQVGRDVVDFMVGYVQEANIKDSQNHKQTARFMSGGSIKEWPIGANLKLAKQ